MVVSHRCLGVNLLNHIRQIHSDKNVVVNYCLKNEYVCDENNTEIEIIKSGDSSGWICILNIQGTKFVHSGRSKKLALNSLLSICHKNLSELII